MYKDTVLYVNHGIFPSLAYFTFAISLTAAPSQDHNKTLITEAAHTV